MLAQVTPTARRRRPSWVPSNAGSLSFRLRKSTAPLATPYAPAMPDVPTREEFDELRTQLIALQDAVELLENPPPELETVEVRMTKVEIEAVLASIFTEANTYQDPTGPRATGLAALKAALGR